MIKVKNLWMVSSLAGLLVGSGATLALPADAPQAQYIYVTNLLDNPNDDFPARTQTPIKIDAYQGGKVCYTVNTLSFGDMYKFVASPTDPNCLYISQLVITPLMVSKLQIYMPATTAINIPGGLSKYSQITIVQKPGTSNAPVFNSDGSVTPGWMSYLIGSGLSAQ